MKTPKSTQPRKSPSKPDNRAVLETQTGPNDPLVRVRSTVPLGEHPPGHIFTLPLSEAQALGSHVSIIQD